MEESAIKRLKSLELNDSDKQSSSTAICVEGYDTSLKEYPLRLALTKHFASCGEITQIYVPRDFKKKILKSVSFMWIKGEGAEDKALQLSGTDVGGWTVIVKPKPKHEPPSPITTISVEGYDTSLQKYLLELILEKHFDSCGEIRHVYVPTDYERGVLKSVGFLRIEGEVAEDKALQLSGTDVGGWTVLVKPSEIIYDNSSHAPATTPEASKIHSYCLGSVLRDMTLRFLRLISRWLCVNISLHVERSGKLQFSLVQLSFLLEEKDV
ncbi:RNA-binding domain superfamily [Arabidopsis suecica]|uniref:RNA-binding domain superfamily n=1 Tax=Arabidopsis suecica TaxID=45249 RepID=A0A8T2DCB7_ARASU|nr:RNA-binding domain superfamily [Arabidopsis suecica]